MFISKNYSELDAALEERSYLSIMRQTDINCMPAKQLGFLQIWNQRAEKIHQLFWINRLLGYQKAPVFDL
jgi:hypothetical protein